MQEHQPDRFVGKRIREYQILDVIGKGGMGAVYRVRHVYLDDERAMKVIHSQFTQDNDFVDRFIREAKILAKLKHPNLVQLYEFGTLDEQSFFMVMEYIRGESLLARVKRLGRLSLPESLRIIREAALGLYEAHQNGVVHRDISPDNLLIVQKDGKEITKIIDFGIAKPLGDQTRIFTRTNFFVGKPEFCSPEQCGSLAEGEIIDHRSDIYSLGITFYVMLTGTLPFSSPTPQGYLLKHIKEEPKAVSFHLPGTEIPPELDRIVAKMLRKKREDRYSTMQDLVKDLDAISGRSIGAVEAIPFNELASGSIFSGRYTIQEKIQERQGSVLYKALDQMMELTVAIKILSRRLFEDSKSLDRFKRGVILARKISHPAVCRIYDIGQTEDTLYVSMEFVKGKSLRDLMSHHGAMAPEAVVRAIKQLLPGVEEMHRAGVVHRSLKPENLMMNTRNKIVIVDFANSASLQVSRFTQPGEVLGSVDYMAPEQLISNDIDSRADIYSIGVLMFQLLTGKLPFEADSPVAAILARLNSNPIKPSAYLPEISTELERIVLKALEREATNRYQTARELLADLDALVM